MRNTSANYKSKFLDLIFSPQVSELRDWNSIKNFHKPPITFDNFPRVSEVFRAFPNISEHFQRFPKIFKNFQKVSEDRFENFPTFSDFFRTSRYFRRPDNFPRFQKNSKMLETYFEHFVTNFLRFPKNSEDFR